MSDGVAVVVWDDQCEMKPAPASGLLQHPGAFTWLLVQGEASGGVWVELAMEMCPSHKWICVMREERKGYLILPALSWQSRIHSEMF